jgi:hypothetical protein
MTQLPVNESVPYATSPRYKILVVAGALLTGLLGWELMRIDPLQGERDAVLGYLFFFIVTLSITLWYAREMFSVVSLTPSSLSVTRRPGQTRCVEFRQMVSVSEGGRLGGRSVTVIFHPLEANGLVDLAGADSLIIPEVDDHDGLLAALEARVPT